MTKLIRVLLNFTKTTAVEFLARCNAVYVGLNLNPAYPNPPISMPDLRATIDAYSAAITAALDGGGAKAIAHRNAVGERLRRMLRQLANYVEANCNGDMTTFLSSGFQAVSSARTRTLPVSESIRKIVPGSTSGEVVVTLVPVPGAVSYELRWAPITSGGSPEEWKKQSVAQIRPPSSIGGLTPGTAYAFQARALTRSGLTDWSVPVNRICT
jgi:hypothetical protein